jgi:hypothetical protein
MISTIYNCNGPERLNQTSALYPVEDLSPAKQLSTVLEDASRARSESAEQLLDLLQGPRCSDVMNSLDSVLNLGDSRNLLGNLGNLSREELAESFAILSDLFARGIVGYETREINGEPQKVFIDVAIGSDAHRAPIVKDHDGRRAPLVKDSRFDSYV